MKMNYPLHLPNQENEFVSSLHEGSGMVWIGGARMHGAKNGAWAWDDKSIRVNFTNWEQEGVDGPEEEDRDDEGPGGAGKVLVAQLDFHLEEKSKKGIVLVEVLVWVAQLVNYACYCHSHLLQVMFQQVEGALLYMGREGTGLKGLAHTDCPISARFVSHPKSNYATFLSIL